MTQRATAFFIFTLSFICIHSTVFADNLNKTAEEYRIRGYEEQQKGNLDQALTFYDKAVTLGGTDAGIFNDIGVVYERLGLLDTAEGYYGAAIKLNPDYLPPYTNLAYLYLGQGDTQRAVAYFRQRYIRARSDDPWKGHIREELNRLDPEFKKRIIQQELEEKKRQLIQNKRDTFALQVMRAERHYQNGQQLRAEKNYGEALVEFERGLTVTPDNPKIVKAKQDVLHEQKLEEAKRAITDAVEKFDAGELESAKEEFQRILSIIPDESIQESE